MRRPVPLQSIDPLLLMAIAFVAAALLALVLTPLVRRIAQRYGIIDRPNQRRVNVVPVPRAGGVAVALAFLAVAVVFVAINDRAPVVRLPTSIGQGELIALLAGGAAAAAIGALDDYFQLRARWQLVGQIVLAMVAVVLGVEVGSLNNPLGGVIDLAGALGFVISVLWIVGMINSINFIDGLDGLSSGIGLVAAITLGVISQAGLAGGASQPFVAILCFALAGALAGFLRWNFHPASIFTGTSGVMFLGYALAVLSILGTAKVAVALLVLGIPIIDTFWIIVRRLLSGRSPFTPDRGHIHHRLLLGPGGVHPGRGRAGDAVCSLASPVPSAAVRRDELRLLPPVVGAVGHWSAVCVRGHRRDLRARPVRVDPALARRGRALRRLVREREWGGKDRRRLIRLGAWDPGPA